MKWIFLIYDNEFHRTQGEDFRKWRIVVGRLKKDSIIYVRIRIRVIGVIWEMMMVMMIDIDNLTFYLGISHT